jgi:hypothetical protein
MLDEDATAVTDVMLPGVVKRGVSNPSSDYPSPAFPFLPRRALLAKPDNSRIAVDAAAGV